MTRLGFVDEFEAGHLVLVGIRKCDAPVLGGLNGTQMLDAGIITGQFTVRLSLKTLRDQIVCLPV